MSTPNLTGAKNEDAPVAKVSAFGPTEAVTLVVTVGGLLAALFGQDWGISSHAESLVSSGYIIGPAVLGISRAIKHHAFAHANAAVYIAQLAAVGQALHTNNAVTPADVAAGVSTLNGSATDVTVPSDPGNLDDVPEDLPADEQPPAS